LFWGFNIAPHRAAILNRKLERTVIGQKTRTNSASLIFWGSCGSQCDESMKQTKSKTAKRNPTQQAPVEASGETVSLEELRRKIAEQVGSQALQMVGAIIDEVKDGEYQPMKFLFEMIGLYPAGGEEESADQDSLARTLLRRLDLPPDPEDESAAGPGGLG